jgi:hypothetical protein
VLTRRQDRHDLPGLQDAGRTLRNTKRLRELISELETLSAQAVEQAEGWAAPGDNRGRHSSYSEDTAIDNVSSPKPRSRGGYSEDTQIPT